MDTELNVSWEADSPGDQKLIRSIRRVRANLLAEHTGLRKPSERRALGMRAGLVDYLNTVARREACRLRRHAMESFLGEVSWARGLVPDDLSIDPESPVIEESIYELISRDKNSIFAKGILLLNELTMSQPVLAKAAQLPAKRQAPDSAEVSRSRRRLDSRGNYRWYVVAAIGVAAAAVAWLFFDP